MLARRDADAVVALGVAAKRTIVRNKLVSASYLIGVLLLLFFQGFTPSEQQIIAYESQLPPKGQLVKLAAAEEAKRIAYSSYMSSKGWFTCDAICTSRRQDYNAKEAAYEALRSSINAQLSTARSHLGVFSDEAVAAARDMFWSYFAYGKQLAGRMTWYDAMFSGFRAMRRDEDFTSWLVELVFQALWNFIVSIFGVTVSFLWGVVDVIRSYQPGFLLGSVFWLGAALAACSVLGSLLLCLYGSFWTAVIVSDPSIVYRLEENNNNNNNARYRIRRDE